MVEEPTHAMLSECLGTRFRVQLDASRLVELELVEVKSLAGRHRTAEDSPIQTREARRASFAILFRGGSAAPLEQGIYRFEHEAVGIIEIFVVPVGRDDEGLYYEAVFN